MDALSFLADVTGYAQAQAEPSSANRPVKLATVDPAYDPASYATGTLPRVTFDGEATMSGKLYPVMAPYQPRPADRVVLVPVGNTYLIIGAIRTGSSMGLVQDWTAPTLAAGYTHNANENGTLQFRVLDSYGTRMVEWRGAVNRGSGSVITTVPAIARPSVRRTVLAPRNAAITNDVKIDFNTDGTAAVFGETTDSAPLPTWIALNGVSYFL
ncbi:hypothetical protein [Actinomadura sp. K4S16]|uniref:hypothetical protein n=1 Tax=Actinomadura sp. K4S16 TaxID=1316147 RepID=UPI0011EF3E6A|nr:hypothetical protein [Actinomadura sp. K4S16]